MSYMEMGDMVFKGEKILIPMQLREETLKRILIWPGMSKQIASMLEQCSVCLEHRMSNANKMPLISHPIPKRPWQTVGTDLQTYRLHSDRIVTTTQWWQVTTADTLIW